MFRPKRRGNGFNMSTSTLTILNPLQPHEIMPEERLELELPDIGYPEHITVLPWRSLKSAGKLHFLKTLPPEARNATILRFEYEDEAIKWWIKEIGFKKLYCTSTSKDWPIANLSYPDYISDKIVNNPNKDFPFSLVGWQNNFLRKTIFDRYKHLPSVIKRDTYGYSVEFERNKAYGQQYIDILSRSRFSLCPRGVGNGTKRIWESLRAGAIPIIISDDLELPRCWDWENTVIRLSIRSVIENPNKVETAMVLPPGRENILRENCLKASEAFTDPNFIAQYLKDTVNGDYWRL